MTNQIFKENLTGKYNGIAPRTLRNLGDISDGKNIRKVDQEVGGWVPRKGMTLHNTTQIANKDIQSLYQFVNPRNDESHFLAQIDSKVYDATNAPPASGTTFGTSIGAGAANAVAFYAEVKGILYIIEATARPYAWGGSGVYPRSFLGAFDTDATAGRDTYTDFTSEVSDGQTDTNAFLPTDSDNVFYICSPEISHSVDITVGGVVNSVTATMAVKSWDGGAWASRSGVSDGTSSGGKTLAQDGTISWTRNAGDDVREFQGVMGYWYRLEPSTALTDGTQVSAATIAFDAARITNKWDGQFQTPLAVRKEDQSAATIAIDYTNETTDGSTATYLDYSSAGATDKILVKTLEPIFAIGLGLVPDAYNTNSVKFSNVEHWDGDSWVSNTITTDDTTDDADAIGLSQTGIVWWEPSGVTVKKKNAIYDRIPGFWYRLTLSGAVSSDVKIWSITVANFPERLPPYTGGVEFKGRLVLWGGTEFPNRLRYSSSLIPDCFSGADSGYTDAFGGDDPILAAAQFYNELIVIKKDSVWLLEGHSPATFGILRISKDVGIASPKTLQVIETGFPAMHKNEPLSVAIWQAVDGVYVLDGRKPRKVSLPVDQFFNPVYSDAIAAGSLKDRQAFIDKNNNEYHLLLPSKELVFDFITDEWYPPWEREEALICGVELKGSDQRSYTYGGNSSGYVYRLENGTVDKDTSNSNVAISCSLKPRAISISQKASIVLRFTFRKLWLEGKAETSGNFTVNFYKNLATSPSVLSAAVDMINTGYDLAFPQVDTRQENCVTFEVEFTWDTTDLELELWSFLYELDKKGEIIGS